MKTRYCDTVLQKIRPCTMGWGDVGTDGVRMCRFDPMERNCYNVVDAKELVCPHCGTRLAEEKHA